jgi:hypothetical protein
VVWVTLALVIVASLLHPLKASLPITFNVEGNITDSKLTHFTKVVKLIPLYPSPMLISVEVLSIWLYIYQGVEDLEYPQITWSGSTSKQFSKAGSIVSLLIII